MVVEGSGGRRQWNRVEDIDRNYVVGQVHMYRVVEITVQYSTVQYRKCF
jgi:hypothetical protein